MSKRLSANLALIFAVLGWVLCFVGVTGQLGDPDRRIARSVMENEERMFLTSLFVGACLAFSSMWLAGYAYSEARVRSLVALALWLLPVIGLGVWTVVSLV
jgi:hypothetical protein